MRIFALFFDNDQVVRFRSAIKKSVSKRAVMPAQHDGRRGRGRRPH